MINQRNSRHNQKNFKILKKRTPEQCWLQLAQQINILNKFQVNNKRLSSNFVSNTRRI